MYVYAHSYYESKGTQDICHLVKEGNPKAIEIIAYDLLKRDIVKPGDIIVPSPQHNGEAEYTKDIANIVSKRTDAKVMDLLKCYPHVPLYEQKRKSITLELKMYMKEIFKSRHTVYFLDNVIATGQTYKEAERLISDIKPLVYAVDVSNRTSLKSKGLVTITF